ncbi:DNA/RNA non-specific endonuclease [Streptomyces natalensis]|uniref:Endonuclease n=1 Tax=Streptomyces natalensis ATCC 27448 TaxID=1240678 RepID=A0A0D7CGC7_9ACTN|nr:DNA/RNA non-specific endonuclease [Streptomyces natalensis]KIZ15091.1 endonuclease [Streptomyces natalensis ATCC 27448]
MTPPDSPRPGGPGGAASRATPTGRTGYDESFLGPAVPLPRPLAPDLATVVLPYTHFSVVLRPDRRLAAATAVCIDGQRLMEGVLAREDNWRFDPRLPEDRQVGEDIYHDNILDRGHLVRRLDPVWGDPAECEAANDDTFHFTNAAPQANVFNQGKKLWQGLENYLLDHAAEFDRKLTVFTGPVLHDSDPPYRGVQVPLRFWKVAAFLQGGALASTGYVLDQSPDLTRDADRALAGATPGGPPPLGAFRTFQVPVSDITELTGLDLGPLPACDLMPLTRAPAERWRRLESPDDMVLNG